MTLNKFTMAGYAYFYRSLLRFNRDIKSGEAAELTYLLYTAVLDSYRYKKTDAKIEEYGPVEFYGNLKRMESRPYRTEIQLYRAAEALLSQAPVRTVLPPTAREQAARRWLMRSMFPSQDIVRTGGH